MAIIGETALSEEDRRALVFADDFERRFVHQQTPRSITETLDLAWEVLGRFPAGELPRLRPELIERYGQRPAASPSGEAHPAASKSDMLSPEQG